MSNGIFITFEGVDGCGKSTQMRLLAEHLEKLGHRCVLTREPGGCHISEQIRTILLDKNNDAMNDRTEAMLYAASRIQHIDEFIIPMLEEGKVVLCDRYIDSSIAYQGFGRALGADYILQLNEYALRTAMPAMTLFFDVKPENAFSRMNEAKEMDRLELEDMGFFDRVYTGFEYILNAYPERVVRLDASGSKFETSHVVRQTVAVLLNHMGK